jgi:hypothetical protein
LMRMVCLYWTCTDFLPCLYMSNQHRKITINIILGIISSLGDDLNMVGCD